MQLYVLRKICKKNPKILEEEHLIFIGSFLMNTKLKIHYPSII